MDWNQIFSSSTPGSDVIYAVASSTINIFAITIPFWLGWFGILIGLWAAIAIAVSVYLAVTISMGKNR